MTFKNSFLLRRSSPPKAGEFEGEETPAERSKLGKVVLAEANQSDLEHLATILRNLNFTVLTAQDGKSALTLARRHHPLLVLASVRLPVLDGYKLAQQLRESKETNAIPFMFVVESGEIPDQLIGHETFANDYIQKPVQIPEFESRVLRLVKLPSSPVEPVAEEQPAAKPKEPEQILTVDAPWLATFDRVRVLLTELASCIGQLERRVRLSSALSDHARETASEAFSNGQETGGRMLGFAARGQQRETGINVGDLHSAAAEGRPEEVHDGRENVPSPAFEDRALVLLERYRNEFRGLSTSPAREPVTPGPSEVASEELPPAASPFELEFDVDLLGKLGVSCNQPNTAEVKAEEFTSFARHSYLSAFREEIDRSARPGDLYEELQDFVLNSIRRAAVGGLPFAARAEALVGNLIESLEKSGELLLRATDRTPAFSISIHSVNVAVLAVRMAQVQERNAQFQHRVGLAGLLHEIGVVKLPERLIFKETQVTETELGILRRRPVFSAGVLKSDFGVVAEIASQVFERENGLGHPRGLQGREIREEAKLIGVADFFEACIHRRPYRRPLSGYHTLYELSKDGEFQQSAVRALAQAVSLFPLNEVLLLNSGEVGKVVGANPKNLAKPKVRILLDSSGVEPSEPLVRDLAQNPSLRVVEVLSAERLAMRRSGSTESSFGRNF